MEEEKKKLSFPITRKRRPSKLPSLSTLAYGDPTSSAPAPTGRRRFVTEFDPSQPLSPAAAAPVAVIPPIPNSGCFGHLNPSSLPTSAQLFPAAARTFVLDTSTGTENSYGYGLNLRAAADDDVEAGLRGMSMGVFAAAVLAGYGWSEGKCVGKRYRNKAEKTSMAVDRRRGGRPAFGYNPSADDPRKSRSGGWTWTVGGADKVSSRKGTAKKRGRDDAARDTTEDKGCNAGRHKSSGGDKRSRTTTKACDKERDGCHSVLWLHSNIRVRVVSEKLGKRLYLMKGKGVDVAAPAACDVVMEDGSELVQGVGQDMLETVLPRTNGRVLVLYGKHRGVCGRLVEKNPEQEIGLVEDADTKAVVRVRYDQMAEYTGDLELLGY